MKVIAFNGSPRRNGNTAQAIDIVCRELEQEGIETEVIVIGDKLLRGCMACGKCRDNMDRRCVLTGDNMNEYIDKILEAQGVILGSPVYFGSMTSPMKALIDRVGYATNYDRNILKNKVGAPVVAVRRAGSNFTYAALNFFFGIKNMPIATSSYWNMTLARNEGEIQQDAEGIETFENLGKNMAFLIKKINA